MDVEQRQAAEVVRRVLAGTTLRDALAAVDDGSALRGRALVQELAYGTLRHWGTLDALTSRLAVRSDIEPSLRALMAVALYQLGHTRAPAFAVVDRAVEAAGAISRPAAKRWVNALLRRYLRERETLGREIVRDPVARWAYPAWWIERVRADLPACWEAVLAAGNARPPLALRVNTRRTSREALLAAFAARGVAAAAAGPQGIIVEPPQAVTSLPGFAEGAFSVQDLGAQLAAPLLDIGAGMRVLDACAAPGGKTTHLRELADVSIVAVDSDRTRLARLRENIARLGLADGTLDVVCGDATTPAQWWDGRPFERILADVPCSASGVVRRHPDVKWLRRASDIAAFAREQDRLLDALWPLLARGGKLLYATCSVFAAENEQRVASFVERRGDALRETIMFPPGVLHTGGQVLPSSEGEGHNQDGFFYALLRKA
jgi:16S rRNA (cytosine967-C5)-methyltransferase